MNSGQRLVNKNDLRIDTWNVRSLYSPGSFRKLLDQHRKLKESIIAIQEIRWTGSGVMEKKEGTMFYSCDDSKHEFGTGFLVHKDLTHLVINFIPINPRLSVIRIKGRFFNYSLINGHAPTEESSEDLKDDFYDALEKVYDECPGNDVKIVLGDFNAQLGKESI